MKTITALTLTALLTLGAISARADGCCAGGKKVSATASATCTVQDPFAKLNLTADQKAKIDALHAECKAGKCTEAAAAKYKAGIKSILTEEQFKQYSAECPHAKSAKTGVGASNTDISKH